MSETGDEAEAVIQRNASRPIPVPDRPWASYQSWDNLLMCHWPIEPAGIRSKVPAELELDLFDGQAWVGLIPMFMGEIRLRDVGGIPTEPHFAELNFRTYVRYGGRAGVYFFNVFSQALLADIGARLFFHTPYLPAAVQFDRTEDGGFHFRSHRVLAFPHHARFDADYRPTGEPFQAEPGSLEEFHSERYSAFARTFTGAIVRGDLIHDPWTLQEADAEIRENTVLSSAGLDLPPQPLHVHYSKGVDTVLWTFVDVTQS